MYSEFTQRMAGKNVFCSSPARLESNAAIAVRSRRKMVATPNSGVPLYDLMFLGVVSASIARRIFLRYREQYTDVRERFAEKFNASIGVRMASYTPRLETSNYRGIFRRRESVECKADLFAIAGAVRDGTRALREKIQRRNRRSQQAKNGGYALI